MSFLCTFSYMPDGSFSTSLIGRLWSLLSCKKEAISGSHSSLPWLMLLSCSRYPTLCSHTWSYQHSPLLCLFSQRLLTQKTHTTCYSGCHIWSMTTNSSSSSSGCRDMFQIAKSGTLTKLSFMDYLKIIREMRCHAALIQSVIASSSSTSCLRTNWRHTLSKCTKWPRRSKDWYIERIQSTTSRK